MPKYKIGLTKATLLCVNTMVGAALFINPKELTKIAGVFGFSGYAIAALIILPLIFSIAALASYHPVSGGLYVYSKTYMHSAVGFLSGWSYFISKAVASGFLVHVFASFLKPFIPFLANVSIFYIDYFIIFSIVLLNVLGVRVGGKTQYVVVALKLAPILFAFICGFFMFTPKFFVVQGINMNSLMQIIPISLYAFAGFEIICAVGGFVRDPARNIKRAIFIAFSSVAVVYILFSIALYGVLGQQLGQSNSTLLALGLKAFPKLPLVGSVVNGIVFASIIGSAFSIFASNCWNFHTLAANNHFPFSNVFTKINSVQAPWVSLLVQAFIACFVLTISVEQVALQNMSVLALFVSSFLTALAAYLATSKDPAMRLPKTVPLFATGACGYVIYLCLGNMNTFGVSLSFLCVFFAGCIIALGKRVYLRRLD